MLVTPADVQDRGAAKDLLTRLKLTLPETMQVWTDSGYASQLVDRAHDHLGIAVRISKKPPDQAGFTVPPRRWIIEPSLSWTTQAWRNVRDYERLPKVAEALITWTAIRLMSRRLAGAVQRLSAQLENAWSPIHGNAYGPFMRTVFVFPPDTLAVTTALLDATMPGRDGFWTDGKLQVELDSEDQRFGLFSDWEPEDVHRVEEALGYHPTWALQVNVSGRIDGTEEIRAFAARILKTGGVAVDDYSDHCWTLHDIERDLKIDGLSFFDFRGHYQKHYQT